MKIKNFKKLGISMVALVITIIVLIILTAAVVITGVNAPKQAQLATFYSNIDTVQDLVSLTMGNNMIEGAMSGLDNNYKWTGIVNDPATAFTWTADEIEEKMAPIMISLLNNTTLADGEKSKYYVGESGKVYYQGLEYEEKTYYNKDKNVAGINKQIEEVVVPQHTAISKTDSFVGYYAGIEKNGSIEIIGIIYADLLAGAEGLEFDEVSNKWSGEWGTHEGAYTIDKIEDASSVKEYYISQEDYGDENFTVTADVITPMGEGADRFYIMALEDVSSDRYYWYKNAYSYNDYAGISDYDEITQEGFGEGRTNTSNMIEAWNSEAYGAKTTERTSEYWGIMQGDMWGAIASEVAKGWFVPSREECSAFGDAFDINDENDSSTYGLSDGYWSSSLGDTNRVWYIYFHNGRMDYNYVSDGNYIRLSATF